jgi:hypothetical protein
MTERDTAVPTNERVLELLRSEIQDAEGDRTRQGLTAWVLAAAAASVLWVGIGLWEGNRIDLHAAARMVTVAAVMIESLRAGSWMLAIGLMRPSDLINSRVFVPSSLPLEYSRVVLAVVGRLLLLALMLFVAPGGPAWAMACLIVPQLIGVIAGVAAPWAVLRGDLPVAVPFGSVVRRGLLGIGALATLVPLAGAVGAALPLLFAAPSTPLPEFRVALIVLALGYLLPILAYVAIPSPYLGHLRALRRDLLLGAVDAVVARRDLEALLVGQELGSVLERYARPLLDTLDEVEKRVAEAQSAIHQLNRLEHDHAAVDLGEKDRLVGEACLAVISARSLTSDFATKRRSLQRRLTMLRYTLRGPLPDFNAALDPVDRRAAELDLRAADVEGKLRTVEVAAERILSAAVAAPPQA